MLDVLIPGMNGMQLLVELDRREFRLPVIMISGHADVPMAVQAVKSGALDFLQKPFRQQDVIDRIYAALALDKARRRRESGCRDMRRPI